MKYFELSQNEYILKSKIDGYDDDSFKGEVEEIRPNTKIVVDASIINYFVTPLYLLIWTFGAVLITSIIVIAFGVLLETDLLYIPIGLAWAIWIFLVVIVFIERKRKKEYLLKPAILLANIVEGHETKRGYVISYIVYFEGKEIEESLFLRTGVTSKRENELREILFKECLERKRILMTVYKDRKLKYYPIKLILNK